MKWSLTKKINDSSLQYQIAGKKSQQWEGVELIIALLGLGYEIREDLYNYICASR